MIFVVVEIFLYMIVQYYNKFPLMNSSKIVPVAIRVQKRVTTSVFHGNTSFAIADAWYELLTNGPAKTFEMPAFSPYAAYASNC